VVLLTIKVAAHDVSKTHNNKQPKHPMNQRTTQSPA
jgi:hypothetical protein